ncbi:MAG: aminotransferase class V-fold PLP-dependent enzyme [Oceanospirillales bacterium TMED33]|nr:MAG: aminotransferase class V-fold PLP-dependent enzyme [Oceanospirillales bacterium TMED33]
MRDLLGLLDSDRDDILSYLGLSDASQLFSIIPEDVRQAVLKDFEFFGEGLDERSLTKKVLRQVSGHSTALNSSCFLGNGCYDHAVPSVIDAIVSRGEFLTAYTPYQPEMSQGLLQALYEFQSSIQELTGLAVVTCGHYDGATALAEAVLMTFKKSPNKKRVFVQSSVSYGSRAVLETYCFATDATCHTFDSVDDLLGLLADFCGDVSSVVFELPGTLALHSHFESYVRAVKSFPELYIIATGHPYGLSEFGFDVSKVADIVACEGQPLGLHMFAGGAHLGMIAASDEFKPYLPGRLVGRVTDIRGRPAFALVYEDREQHVARDKATSNICSNQALNALRACIFFRLYGVGGIRWRYTRACLLAKILGDALSQMKGITVDRGKAIGFELLLSFDNAADLLAVIDAGRELGVNLGVTNAADTRLNARQILVSVTESKSVEDLVAFITAVNLICPQGASTFRKIRDRIHEEFTGLAQDHPIAATEIEVVRHFTNLSRRNYGVDTGSYPLGSCTMKYNPKRNDLLAELTELKYLHPLQSPESMPGLIAILDELKSMLGLLLGMDAIDLTPGAGAHGELKGLLIAKKYHIGEGHLRRNKVIVPESAHGTNPATAAMCGFSVQTISSTSDGLIDIDVLKAALDDTTAVVMITNPSTLGVFEAQIESLIELTHAAGALAYYDGANMNALMGYASPGRMGFDIAHINLHKTLSTPHGGGGPGAGPVGVKQFLAKFTSPGLVYDGIDPGILPIKMFFGHVSVLIRAYYYLKTMGGTGLRRATEDAVLNANYLKMKLQEFLPVAFEGRCMHEFVMDASSLGVKPIDLAKRMIDYGVHPPTLVGAGCVYYGDSLSGAMLFEPTESESKQELDYLVEVVMKIIEEAKADMAFVETAPYTMPVSKIVLG